MHLLTRPFRRFQSVLFLALAIGLIATPLAQEPPGEESEPGGSLLSVDSIQSEIDRLESANGQSAADSAVLENYRQALDELQKAKREQERALSFKETVDNPDQPLNKLRESLSRVTKSPPELPPKLSVDELTKRYNQAQLDRQQAQAQLQELENRQASERFRPAQSGVELAETKRQLDSLESRLGSDTASDMPVHQKTLLRATRDHLKNRIDRLEMERLSHIHRVNQLNLRIKLAQTILEREDAQVRQLQERISALQIREVEQIQQQTLQAQQQAAGKHPLIQQYADSNATLGTQLARLTASTERVTRELEQAVSRKDSLRHSQERVQQLITIGSLDERPGHLLQKQRNALPKPSALAVEIEEQASQIATARLESLQIEEQWQQLQSAIDNDRIETYRPDEMPDAEWRELRSQLNALLDSRLALLNKLRAAYSRYEKALTDLSAQQLQLYDRVEQYAELLDQHLLWIPSTERINSQTFSDALDGLGWFFSARNWENLAAGLALGFQRYPYLITLLIFAFIVLLGSRGRMLLAMKQIVPAIGNVAQDNFMHTVRVFLFTLLLALPWPLLLATLGWWLRKGSDHDFVDAMAVALARLGLFIYIIQILRYLFIKNGLATVHFRWNPATGRLFRRHLNWLLPVLIPLGFIVGVFEAVDQVRYSSALGRMAFVAGMLLAALFFHRILNPWTGFLTHDQLRRHRLRRLWYPTSLLVTLGLAVLALAGYYYSALNLERMFLLSLFSGILVYLVYYLLVRWLLVAERRLALARAKAKRQAAQEARASKEVADAAGEGLPELADLDEVNLTTINAQTRRLLRVGGGILFVVMLYPIWEQMIPALTWLDDIVLWQFKGDAGQLTYISLWDGILALLVLIVMITAGRNLPGLLEIALLQPMNLDIGSRYAISTLSRYTIYATGILLVLNLVGLQWNDVQWLVAAMGVGLGFGLKEIFANFFSGILILFERPIRIGDTVTIGDISGTISRIRIRATTITDWDNKELVVPNKNFITDPLINWTLSDPVTRIVIRVGIAYGSDTDAAHRIMTEVVERHPDVLKDPRATIFFVGFGDSSLDFDIRVFVSDNLKRMPLLHDLHMSLNKALHEGGIEIPFPQRDLHIRSIDPDIKLSGESPPPGTQPGTEPG